MPRHPSSSIRKRLLWLSVTAASTSLLLACAAFVAYDLITFRETMVRNLRSYADIIASSSAAAVLFQDPRSATETLAAVRAEPHILFAEIRTPDGRSFARYHHPELGGKAPSSAPLAPGEDHRFERDRLILSRPILSERATIAHLQLHSDLRARAARTNRFLLISAGILAVSLAVCLLIAHRLQQGISAAIGTLVDAARHVSEDKNYSIRVGPDVGAGEIGLLAKTFDEMLAQIERQDAELRQAVKARDEFLSIASHELKTPLTPLQLQVESLQNVARRQPEGAGATRLLNGLQMADRQVGRLTSLINNLLDISRITSHRLKLDYEVLDLTAVVREVAGRFQEELARAGCTLTIHADAPVSGTWDRMRLEQVVSNFLANAAKYGAGKPVEVWVEGNTDSATVRVRDHGIGIAPGDQARIFERFERAVSEQSYGGFGLGLWIVRQIVDAMGGKVSVESKLGEGATFSVTLPTRKIGNVTYERRVKSQTVGSDG